RPGGPRSPPAAAAARGPRPASRPPGGRGGTPGPSPGPASTARRRTAGRAGPGKRAAGGRPPRRAPGAPPAPPSRPPPPRGRAPPRRRARPAPLRHPLAGGGERLLEGRRLAPPGALQEFPRLAGIRAHAAPSPDLGVAVGLVVTRPGRSPRRVRGDMANAPP